MPSWDQIRAPAERVLLLALGYAVAKGWIERELVGDVVAILLAAGAAGYGWWTTRPTVIASRAAAALPEGTVIVTSPEIARDTPNIPNVISNATSEVVPK